MTRIAVLLTDLESKITHKDMINLDVSTANVGWHMDHSLKVINSVLTVLQKSEANYRWNLNLKRTYFLIVKRIPRGKAKAPKFVQSFEEITIKAIEGQLKTARILVPEVEAMNTKINFKHPYIGQMNLKQALLFLEIHTQHHLKIIHDILHK